MLRMVLLPQGGGERPGRFRPLIIVAAILAAASPAAAKRRMYSYDPVTPVTKTLAEGGFTFLFDDKSLGGQKLLTLLSTVASAEASLQRADEKDLGASLDSLAGHPVQSRDLYEILPDKEGAPLIRAACPGSDRAWLAFGKLKRVADLRVEAFGRYADGGKAHHCATLDFSWRGEWKLPERAGSRRPTLGPSPIPRRAN